MEQWWASLTTFQQVTWAITIPVTIIFALQTILTFSGIGGDNFADGVDIDTDVDIDFDSTNGDGNTANHGASHYFNFRNFINFFLGFGWSIIALQNVISNKVLLVIISCLIGILLVAVVMSIFYGFSQMTQSGTMNINNAMNKIAEVYLSIPAQRGGVGKVHITIQNTLHELDAMTDGEPIATGQWAKVIAILDNQILLVERITGSHN